MSAKRNGNVLEQSIFLQREIILTGYGIFWLLYHTKQQRIAMVSSGLYKSYTMCRFSHKLF